MRYEFNDLNSTQLRVRCIHFRQTVTNLQREKDELALVNRALVARIEELENDAKGVAP